MYRGTITLEFDTKTKEQLEYVLKFFDDAQSVMQCESSRTVSQSIRDLSE